MEWPEDLASELPANRGDEPAELRRRIIAELRDHLDSALQRELLRTGDAAQARQNVLFRFGDPARLARKLWFDAMWEKIMMQRGMLVAIMAMVVVSAGSMGLTWFMVVQAGQVNKAILAKLEALGNPKEAHGKSTDWNPLKFRVTGDKSDGAPVAGVKIAIQGQDYGTISGIGLERTTGPDGIADFGLVKGDCRHNLSCDGISGNRRTNDYRLARADAAAGTRLSLPAARDRDLAGDRLAAGIERTAAVAGL